MGTLPQVTKLLHVMKIQENLLFFWVEPISEHSTFVSLELILDFSYGLSPSLQQPWMKSWLPVELVRGGFLLGSPCESQLMDLQRYQTKHLGLCYQHCKLRSRGLD